MVELGIDSSEPGGIESAAKDANVQKALANLTNSLTQVNVEQNRHYWDQTEVKIRGGSLLFESNNGRANGKYIYYPER